MPLTIRQATSTDARLIAAVEVASRHAAFDGLWSADYLATQDEAARSAYWERFIGNKAEPSFVYLAEEDGAAVGFACVGPGRDPGLDGSMEIMAMHVMPGHTGKGIGKKLLAACFGYAAKYAYQHSYIWLLPQQTRAINFFKRNGAREDMAEKKSVTHDGITHAPVMLAMALDY